MSQQGLSLALLLQCFPQLVMANENESQGMSWGLIAGALVLGLAIGKRTSNPSGQDAQRILNIQSENDKLKQELDQFKKQIEHLKELLKENQQQTGGASAILQTDSVATGVSDKELEKLRNQKEELERSLDSIRKQEREWEQFKAQLIKENQQLKDSITKLEHKNQTATQENNQLRNQISEKERASEKLISEQLQDLKHKYESSDALRLQQAKLSKLEAEELKGKVRNLEGTLKEYQDQLDSMREKYKALQETAEEGRSKEEDSGESQQLSSQESTPRQNPSDDDLPPSYQKPPPDDELPVYQKPIPEEKPEEELPPYNGDLIITEPLELDPALDVGSVGETPKLDIPDDIMNFLDAKEDQNSKPKLDIPDDIMNFLEAKENQSSKEGNEFDLSNFKKSSTKKVLSRKSSRKGFDMSTFAYEDSTPIEETKPATQANEPIAVDNSNTTEEDDFMAKLMKKPKVKEPSFMSIFKQTNEPDEKKIPDVEVTTWGPGDPLVKTFSVKEDANAKARGKTRVKGVGFGSPAVKAHDMEDQNLVEFPFDNDPTKGLFCVFDGHGGRDCAATAKEAFAKELSKQISLAVKDTNDFPTDLTSVFKTTFLEVDSQLLQFEYMGCTGTSVFVWQVGEHRYLQAANVGDSTAFLNRTNEVLWLTRDHKATSPEERERIQASGAELNTGQTRVMGGLAVSRALGDHFLKQEKVGLIGEPYVSPSIKLEETDSVVILASDGLWDVMTGEEAMALISGLENAESMARRLIQNALANTKCTDNITVIVIQL